MSPTGHRGAFRGRNRAGSDPKEDRRTPPKLPELEHVALNSASETGAKMRLNAQICKLNFKNFLGPCPRPHTGEGLRRPSPDPLLPYRASFGAFGPSIVPPTRNPGSTPGAPTLWKSWLRLCALTICRRKLGSSLPKKIGGQTTAASPSQKSWIRHWIHATLHCANKTKYVRPRLRLSDRP